MSVEESCVFVAWDCQQCSGHFLSTFFSSGVSLQQLNMIVMSLS